jgi:hypothetical protein
VKTVRTSPRPLAVLFGCATLPAILLVAAGCGSGSSRSSVSGTVQFDGKPVPDGTVRFIAVDQGNNNTNGAIRDGKYELTAEAGPLPGKYKVQISWPKKTGKQVNTSENEDPEYAMPEVIEQIPDKYNKKTTLEAVIQSGANTHNFDLKR